MKILQYLIIVCILLASSMYSQENNLYLSYEQYPKKIYQNQIFEIKLKLLASDFNFDELKYTF